MFVHFLLLKVWVRGAVTLIKGDENACLFPVEIHLHLFFFPLKIATFVASMRVEYFVKRRVTEMEQNTLIYGL